MHMNGPRRLGRTTNIGAQTPLERWHFSTETNYGGPVIGGDGTIYQGTLFGELLAIRPNGSIKWIAKVPGTVEATPAILLDGRIAFANSEGTLYVVNPDGTPSWRFDTGSICQCFAESSAIGSDGTIYLGTRDTLYALYPDGTVRWTFPAGISGAPAVAPDGTVYLPSSSLHAIGPDGQEQWQFDASDTLGVGGSPAVGPGGTIYANSFLPTVYAINPDGTLKWKYKVADCCASDVPASPAGAPDGTVYVGELTQVIPSVQGVMVALNPDGTLKWEQHYGGSPTSASIGGDGTIYFGSGTHNPAALFAVNPDGTLKWRYKDPRVGEVRTPPAIGKGRVYAGGIGDFFAIGP
jgi:outer membrane protein assembly factor BamB